MGEKKDWKNVLLLPPDNLIRADTTLLLFSTLQEIGRSMMMNSNCT